MKNRIRQIVREELNNRRNINEDVVRKNVKTFDGHTIKISYNMDMDSVNINVIDASGYPWGIERIPLPVALELTKMLKNTL